EGAKAIAVMEVPAGLFALQAGVAELKKLSVRQSTPLPVRKTFSFAGHWRTGTKPLAKFVQSMPFCTRAMVLPPLVTREMFGPAAVIQSVSGWLVDIATSPSQPGSAWIGASLQRELPVQMAQPLSLVPPNRKFGLVG